MFCAINLLSMEISHIRAVLTTTNLVPQPSTYEEVSKFLQDVIGIYNKGSNYEVLAAFSIVSQIQKIKAVDNSEEVSTGIHLQAVMKHLRNHSKQMLLSEVERQCQKWRESPPWLKSKIDSVKIAYRIYKKYGNVFQELSKNCSHLDNQSQFTLMGIFWVVYLFIKNSTPDSNALESTRILQALFKYVFGQLMAQLNQSLITRHFRDQFRQSEPIQFEAYEFYKRKMEDKLMEIQEQQRGKELDLLKLVTHQHLMIRFLDDISNHYQKFKSILSAHYAHYVDQLSFLQLQKNLTPLPVKRDSPKTNSISKKLNFADESQDDFESNDEGKGDDNSDKGNFFKMDIQPPNNSNVSAFIRAPDKKMYSKRCQPVSPFRQEFNPRQQWKGTPITARNQNLSWVNKITQSNQRQNLEQLKTIYQFYSGKDYATYQNQAFERIFAAIDTFTPACMDFSKRQRSIYSFFAFFIKTVYNKHQQHQRQIIFSNNNYFNAILCLSTNLFNYAYQSLQSSYIIYCQIFGIGIIQGQIPINWFGLNAQMPKNIEIYLYDLQKRILIQQVWNDDSGYKLLTENSSTYQGQVILKRIKRHADQRTQELCQAMKIQPKQIGKVINLLRFILQKRHNLLKDHNIDQIIVCAITSIVSINRSQTMSLAETFQHYNKLLFSLNISRSIYYDRNGQPIDIVDFYNHIFLPQLDQIIYNEEEAANILNTPVRIELKNRSEPIACKFRQFTTEELGKKKAKVDQDEKYRNRYIYHNFRLVKNLMKPDIHEKDEENIQEDMPSPSFGGGNQVLYRTYSFGDIADRDKF